MTDYPPVPPEDDRPDGRDYWATRPPWYAVLAGGAIFVILVVVLALLLRDEGTSVDTVAPTLTSPAATTTTEPGDQTTTSDSDSTTAATTSTTAPSTTTSTTAGTTTTEAATTTTAAATTTTADDPSFYTSAMWPWFESSLRYTDPVDAARGFAEDYVGFTAPIVGEFMQGDSRSGEVEVKPTEDGPVTTILVRQLGPASHWWVLGAVTEHTLITAPDALEAIDNPLQVAGEALAFEGVVEVELRADGSTTPLVAGTVTGGGGEMRPFEGDFVWTNPGDGGGAVLLLTRDQDDDGVWTVSAVRVAFATD